MGAQSDEPAAVYSIGMRSAFGPSSGAPGGGTVSSGRRALRLTVALGSGLELVQAVRDVDRRDPMLVEVVDALDAAARLRNERCVVLRQEPCAIALVAEEQPGAFAELLADAGLQAQDRAPMTPVVKLVFGANYDKTRLAEYACVLGHAKDEGVARGELASSIGGFACVSFGPSLAWVVHKEREHFAGAPKAARWARRPLLVSLIALTLGFCLVSSTQVALSVDSGFFYDASGLVAFLAISALSLSALTVGLASARSMALGYGGRILALVLPTVVLGIVTALLADFPASPVFGTFVTTGVMTAAIALGV